jgi:hypothetical protein
MTDRLHMNINGEFMPMSILERVRYGSPLGENVRHRGQDLLHLTMDIFEQSLMW